MDAALETRDLVKRFGDVTALDDARTKARVAVIPSEPYFLPGKSVDGKGNSTSDSPLTVYLTKEYTPHALKWIRQRYGELLSNTSSS